MGSESKPSDKAFGMVEMFVKKVRSDPMPNFKKSGQKPDSIKIAGPAGSDLRYNLITGAKNMHA